MSQPIKKPNQSPESYSPKKPETLGMAELLQHEKRVETIQCNGAVFEVVERPETIWVGTISYANNHFDEPDMGALLKRYQDLVFVAPKEDRINPDWDAAISINYRKHGEAPKGMMYAQETYSAEKQDERYDLFTQPGGLWIESPITNRQPPCLVETAARHGSCSDISGKPPRRKTGIKSVMMWISLSNITTIKTIPGMRICR